jgi:hypothetical protein
MSRAGLPAFRKRFVHDAPAFAVPVAPATTKHLLDPLLVLSPSSSRWLPLTSWDQRLARGDVSAMLTLAQYIYINVCEAVTSSWPVCPCVHGLRSWRVHVDLLDMLTVSGLVHDHGFTSSSKSHFTAAIPIHRTNFRAPNKYTYYKCSYAQSPILRSHQS